MKILYFYQYFTTPKGSWGTRVYEFARRWVVAGDTVTVITSVYDKSDLKPKHFLETIDIDGIEVRVINVKLSNKHRFIYRIYSFIAYSIIASWYALTIKADVVVASSGPITVGIPGLIARYVRGLPLVFEVRDLWPQGAIELGYLRNKGIIFIARKFEYLCYRSSSLVIALSEGMSDWIKDYWGYDNIIVIPNASDNELFSFSNNQLPPNGINPDRQLILYTGTLGYADNCEQIIYAAKALEQAGRKDIEIVLIGDGLEREMLKKIIKIENLHNVRILGIMPKTEIALWLNQAVCSLVTFRNKKFLDTNSPNKMFDSFAAGVPIVHTTKGWIRNLTMKENCGIAVPPDDPNAMADAVMRLVDEPKLRKEMANNALHLARNVFDRDILAEKMRNALHDVVENRKN